MNIKKIMGAGVIGLAAVALLAGCRSNSSSTSAGSSAKTDLKVAIVTDTGGINDRSFNQSAWEGLQKWGKDNGLSEGKGFKYFQSNSASDYVPNFNAAQSGGYKLVYGIGFSLQGATESAAKNNADTNYVIIDSVIEGQKNVASATFADEQGAYLAGVAAAKTTKTNKVGFIGGEESAIITAFQVGFEKGVASVNPSIKVDVQYAGSFTDASKGQAIATSMYNNGDDIVYQCAGGVGVGAFTEAKALNQTKNEADKVWLIGVDQDQKYLGDYTSKDGKKSNFVLVSTIKEVGKVVEDVSTKTAKGNFPGGQTLVYNLKNKGVDLGLDNASAAAKTAVATAKADIISGKITVPSK
ncbi:BMP family lipoprotein [Lactovum miscens]|uniref:Basic membrane protein A n=1 Tax=Lactovum miscens TaxID=190387 RepID=A0A841C3X8_9LACT|nr:BMP family protein [Lactovum miscens]MBB5888646.1 basic membrane protein A [Lactovum miscens]